MAEVQCPNCGGYKTSSSKQQYTERKETGKPPEPFEEWRKESRGLALLFFFMMIPLLACGVFIMMSTQGNYWGVLFALGGGAGLILLWKEYSNLRPRYEKLLKEGYLTTEAYAKERYQYE